MHVHELLQVLVGEYQFTTTGAGTVMNKGKNKE